MVIALIWNGNRSEGHLTNNVSEQMVVNYKNASCNEPHLPWCKKRIRRISLFVDAMKAAPDSIPDDQSNSGQ
jgi:hypothetical protein